MPERYDFQVGSGPGGPKGFMLARGANRGRAWHRSSIKSVPGRELTPGYGTSAEQLIFKRSELRFATTPPDVRFAEVFDDFSGGFGHAYRSVAPPNGIHWSENIDTRFPGQAVHVQALLTATLYDNIDGAQVGGVSHLVDIPLSNPVPPGFGSVFAFGRRENLVTDHDSWVLAPRTGLFPAALDATSYTATSRNGLEGPAALFGSYLYVGGSSGNFHRYDVDGGVVATLGPEPIHGFVTAGNRLWGSVGSRKRPVALRSIAPGGTDGMVSADWSATIMVGNGHRPIQALTSLAGQVFAGLSDGLYAGDQSGTFVNVTGALAQLQNADNWRDLCVHEGAVVGQHTSGIYAYDPTSTVGSRLRALGPVQRSNRSPVQGLPYSVTSFGGWLYAGLWTGSASYLLAGHDVGAGPYEWHVLHRVPTPGRVGRLHVDGVSYASGLPAVAVPNRMWLAMEGSFADMQGAAGGTAPLYFQPMPRLNGNPLAPDPLFSANYVGSARLDLPAVDRGAPGVVKVWESLDVWADGFLSGSRYADVYYTADRGPRTLLGRAQTSPVSTLLMGSTNGSFVTARSLEVSVESFDATPGTCQAYRAVVVWGNLRPEYTETIEAVVAVADETPDRRGTPMRPAAVVIDDLRALCDPLRLGGQPHRLIDLAGATSYVVFDGMPEEVETYQEGAQTPELTASVKMVVLTLTQNTQ